MGELRHLVRAETLSQHAVGYKAVWGQAASLCLTALVITLLPVIEQQSLILLTTMSQLHYKKVYHA